MAKNILKASQIKSATCRSDGKPKEHNDGEGLYLKAFKNGAKSFRYDFKFAGKYQTLVHGSYPDCSGQVFSYNITKTFIVLIFSLFPRVLHSHSSYEHGDCYNI
jgi:hypothetical protein